ncbi:MAG: cysteine desulfurase [Methylococcaceae bacterium]|nr:cysteine desulfurase [Methylococcaceae bacterium]
MIYLDHNATTPIDERVLDAMLPYLKSFYGNPSSLYRQGRFAHTAINRAREQVAALVGSSPSQIIFTSGGTEANNMALATLPKEGRLAISAIEHPSITEPALRLKHKGHEVSFVDVDQHGLITEAALDNLIRFQPNLVSIMLANNETGVIQDIAVIASRLTEKGILLHSDAVQALGKLPIGFDRLGIHLMSVSSHKIYGPKGCGALIFDKNVAINPIIFGGGQEQGLRAGTENVAAIVGFGKAAELAQAELVQRNEHLAVLRNLLENCLTTIPGLTIFAQAMQRLPNTVQFGIPEIDGEMLLMKLDQKGVAVSSASACASGGGKPSPVLTAMGIEAGLAKSAIRISLGQTNTEADILKFFNLLKPLIGQGSSS